RRAAGLPAPSSGSHPTTRSGSRRSNLATVRVHSSDPLRPRFLCQPAGDALKQRPTNAPQRIVNALGRTAAATCRRVDARAMPATLRDQRAIRFAQLLDTLGQGIAAVLQLVPGHLGLGLKQEQTQAISEVQPLPAPAAEEVGQFPPRDPTG